MRDGMVDDLMRNAKAGGRVKSIKVKVKFEPRTAKRAKPLRKVGRKNGR